MFCDTFKKHIKNIMRHKICQQLPTFSHFVTGLNFLFVSLLIVQTCFFKNKLVFFLNIFIVKTCFIFCAFDFFSFKIVLLCKPVWIFFAFEFFYSENIVHIYLQYFCQEHLIKLENLFKTHQFFAGHHLIGHGANLR